MIERLQTRRDLLLAGASGMAATLLSGKPVSGEDKKPAMVKMAPSDKNPPLPAKIKLSLAGFSFRKFLDTPGKPGQMSLFDVADLCARLGLDAIEPTSYYFLKTDDDFIYKLKHYIFKLGLGISGTPIRNNFCMPAGKELDEQLDHVRNWVDISAKLGSPNMRIFAGKPNKNISRDKAFECMVSATKEACAYAGSRGIFLALENHGYLTETADDVLRIYEAVKSPWLGINLDTGNFRGEPYSNMAKCAPYTIVCQVKTDVGDPKSDQRQPADYNRIIKILRDARYRGYVTLEYSGPDPHKEVPIHIDKLQAALKV